MCNVVKVKGVLFSFILLLISSFVNAVVYEIDTTYEVSTSHDNNFRTAVDNKESFSETSFEPHFLLQAKDQTWQSTLDVGMDFSRFNRPEYDSDDQDVSWLSSYTGEKFQFSGNIDSVRNTTRTSEFEDSGIIGDIERKVQNSASLSAIYSLSELNQLSLNMAITDVAYETRLDYEFRQGSIAWTHFYNEKLNFTLRANVNEAEYDPEDVDVVFVQVVPFSFAQIPFFVTQSRQTITESTGFQLGSSYQFSENFSMNFNLGRRESETSYKITDPEDFCPRSAEDPFFFAGPGNVCNLEQQDSSIADNQFGLEWSDERLSVNLNYSNSTTPSSNGYVTEDEDVNFTMAYRASEKSDLSLTLTYGERTSIDVPPGVNPIINNRTFERARFRYGYSLTEEWKLVSTVNFRSQDREIVEGVGESTIISFGINYKPKRAVWSR